MKQLLLILALALVPLTAVSVEPNEMLADPALEARARVISKEIRCPQCQNENIDASNASIAKDLRIILRERLVAGDTDEQAVAFLVDRYGEFILFNPAKSGLNLVLWIAGPIMFLFALLLAGFFARRRQHAKPVEILSDDEEAQLGKILGK